MRLPCKLQHLLRQPGQLLCQIRRLHQLQHLLRQLRQPSQLVCLALLFCLYADVL